MEYSDSDNDTTDKDTDEREKSFSDSAEAFTMHNEELNANLRGNIRPDVSEL
jgi:hypothetical protein